MSRRRAGQKQQGMPPLCTRARHGVRPDKSNEGYLRFAKGSGMAPGRAKPHIAPSLYTRGAAVLK